MQDEDALPQKKRKEDEEPNEPKEEEPEKKKQRMREMEGGPDEFMCPISLDLMQDPWIDGEGNTYERESIVAWLKNHARSPVTRQPLSVAKLIPNRALKSAVDRYRVEHGLPVLPAHRPAAAAAFVFPGPPVAPRREAYIFGRPIESWSTAAAAAASAFAVRRRFGATLLPPLPPANPPRTPPPWAPQYAGFVFGSSTNSAIDLTRD